MRGEKRKRTRTQAQPRGQARPAPVFERIQICNSNTLVLVLVFVVCFNTTIKNYVGSLPTFAILNRVQAHGVKKAVAEVADRVHEKHRPKHGVGDGIQLAAGGEHLEERKKHVEHQREGRKHHEPVKPGAVLAVGEGGEPAPHGVRVGQLHDSGVHFETIYRMNTENK